MKSKGNEASEDSSPLLCRGNDGVDFEENWESEACSISATLIFSTITAVFSSFFFGVVIAYSAPTQYQIMHDLHLSLAQYSTFGSILFIGSMIGAIITGRIADYAGRRVALACSEIFCILGSLIIAFSKVPVYIAEIAPKNLRGTFTELHEFMLCFGLSLTYLIGAFLNWRILAVIGCIPCLLQLLSLPFIPDSPRWLAKVGRLKESESALQRLRGRNADIYQEATEIRDYTEALQQQPEASFAALFQAQYSKSLTVGVGLIILQQSAGITAFASYTNSIFISAGFSDTVGTISMVAVKIPMVILGVLLMDKCGRRPLLLASAVGSCLGSFLTALSFLLKDLHVWKGISPLMALAGVLVYMGSFSVGLAGIPLVIMSEIFPINVKGSAGSLLILISCFCSLIVTYAFNFLTSWSSEGTFFIFSIICGLTILFVAKLVPETKDRTLEEIQASLNS